MPDPAGSRAPCGRLEDAVIDGDRFSPRTAAPSDAEHGRWRALLEAPTRAKVWGAGPERAFIPPLSSTVYGDGEAVLCVSPIKSRPAFWQVRIDSEWRHGDGGGPPRRNSDVAQGVHAIARNLAREFGAAFDLSEGFSWQRGGPDAAVPRDPDKPHYHPVLRFGLEAPGAMARSELDGRLGHVDVGPGNALRSAEAIAVCPRVADAADVEHERLRAALCVPQTGELRGQPVEFTPPLSNAVYGDGRALLCVSTRNDRPKHWLVRIDSQWRVVGDPHLPPDAPDVKGMILAILDNLEAEFGDGGLNSRFTGKRCGACPAEGACESCQGCGFEPCCEPPEFPAIDTSVGFGYWRQDYPQPPAPRRLPNASACGP